MSIHHQRLGGPDRACKELTADSIAPDAGKTTPRKRDARSTNTLTARARARKDCGKIVPYGRNGGELYEYMEWRIMSKGANKRIMG